MRARFTLVFFTKVFLTIAVILGVAGAIMTIKGGPTLPHDRLARAGDATGFTSRYRVLIDYAPRGGEFEPVAIVESNAPEEFKVRMESDLGILELLAIQERIYTRQRQFVVDKAEWSGPSPRGLTMYPAIGPFFHPTAAIQATYAAFNAKDMGQEWLESTLLTRYQGKVNPAYAYQRGYALWLVRTKRAKPIKEASLGSSPPTLAWVEKFAPSLRGRIDTQEEALRFFTKYPATVDVWVHPKDTVAYQIQFTMPPEAAEMGYPDGVIRFRFRDFNHEFDYSPFSRYPELPEPPIK